MKRLLIVLLGTLGCGDRTLEAVSGRSCLERPEHPACARDHWPNEFSRSNSDPWLDAHADGLRVMRPRLLVLNFHNALGPDDLRALAQRQIDALAEGSRYHGYAEPAAPAFLQYELGAMVDLRDPAPPPDWPHSSSTLVPLNEAGTFDLAALFEEPYTTRLGQRDPEQPERVLGLCEQFERGLVNELWLAVGDETPGREPVPMIECKAHRDEAGARDEGAWVATSSAVECANLPPCDVTVRIAHLSPLRGLGCDLLVRGWAIPGSMAAIPYLRRNAARYFNADLDQRYGAPVPNLLALCPEGVVPCVAYPTPSTLESVVAGGPMFRIEGYGQGCGTPEFPANATFIWDWENPLEVESRCESYGLGNAADGGDLPSLYSFAKVAENVSRYPDCGGAWQIYWRQNMPGLDNRALAEDGSPMKNWWPFLFF